MYLDGDEKNQRMGLLQRGILREKDYEIFLCVWWDIGCDNNM